MTNRFLLLYLLKSNNLSSDQYLLTLGRSNTFDGELFTELDQVMQVNGHLKPS